MVAVLSGITPAQYLEWERKAETKSEYINGRIYAMSGASREHNLIAVSIGVELRSQLKRGPCEAYTSDMRIHIEKTGMYAYPDLSVTCDEPGFADSHVDTLLNPLVLFEILSPSTEAYDRGSKFAHYRRIASLQEYVMVTQDQALVERYARQGEQWVLTEYRGLDAELEVASIQCRIALREIYDKVTFPTTPDTEGTGA